MQKTTKAITDAFSVPLNVMYHKWPGEIPGVMYYVWSEKTEETLITSTDVVN